MDEPGPAREAVRSAAAPGTLAGRDSASARGDRGSASPAVASSDQAPASAAGPAGAGAPAPRGASPGRRRDPLAFACSLLLVAMTAVCLIEVALRYGSGATLGFYDELAGFLLVWLTFLGAVLARRDRAHIGVRDLVERLPDRPRLAAQLVEHAAMLLLHLAIAWFGAVLALRFATERAITMPVPMGLFYSVLPVSALLTAALEVKSLLVLLRPRRAGRPCPDTAR